MPSAAFSRPCSPFSFLRPELSKTLILLSPPPPSAPTELCVLLPPSLPMVLPTTTASPSANTRALFFSPSRSNCHFVPRARRRGLSCSFFLLRFRFDSIPWRGNEKEPHVKKDHRPTMYDVYFCEGGKEHKNYTRSHCHPLSDYLLVA